MSNSNEYIDADDSIFDIPKDIQKEIDKMEQDLF